MNDLDKRIDDSKESFNSIDNRQNKCRSLNTNKRRKITSEWNEEILAVDEPNHSSPKQISESEIRKLINDELQKFRMEIQQLLSQQKNEIKEILKTQKTAIENLLLTQKENVKEQLQEFKLCHDTLTTRVETLSQRVESDLKIKLIELLLRQYQNFVTELHKETTSRS